MRSLVNIEDLINIYKGKLFIYEESTVRGNYQLDCQGDGTGITFFHFIYIYIHVFYIQFIHYIYLHSCKAT